MSGLGQSCAWFEKIVSRCCAALMSFFSKNCNFYFLVAALFAIVTFWIYCIFISFPIEKTSDLASWVQAVGSIAAILGAFWIAASQRSDADRREEMKNRRNQATEASLLESFAAESYLEVSNLMLYCQRHKDNTLFAFSGEKLENVEFLLRSFIATSTDPSLSLIAVGLLQDTSDALSTINWCKGKNAKFPPAMNQHHRDRTERVQSQFLAAQALSTDRHANLSIGAAERAAMEIASERVADILKTIGTVSVPPVEASPEPSLSQSEKAP